MLFYSQDKSHNAESLLTSCLELRYEVIADEIPEIASKRAKNLILVSIKDMTDFVEKLSAMTFYNKISIALAKNYELKYFKF